jgi:hypothetical protein
VGAPRHPARSRAQMGSITEVSCVGDAAAGSDQCIPFVYTYTRSCTSGQLQQGAQPCWVGTMKPRDRAGSGGRRADGRKTLSTAAMGTPAAGSSRVVAEEAAVRNVRAAGEAWSPLR